MPIVLQEIDTFHVILFTRGKLLYGLDREALLPLHLAGTRISRESFAALLAETGVHPGSSRAVGRVVAESTGTTCESMEAADPGIWERLAWTAFWRCANRAFRHSHMGKATAIAYVELRRMEVANLITICEGIRAGVSPEAIYARLIPLQPAEAAHV